MTKKKTNQYPYVLMFVPLCLLALPVILYAANQEGISVTSTNTPNQIANDRAKGGPITNEVSKALLLSQRLGGPVSEVLLRNQFIVGKDGILRRKQITVGDLKRLLKFENRELEPLDSVSINQEYELPFKDVRCFVDVVEEYKDIDDDATLVNVSVSTNSPPYSTTRNAEKKRGFKFKPASQ
ncbi:MAG: hypothetical protein NTV49_03045 [Kiritimatiellaeota bacterium]|nr:hypothetical protein [Kiritimatiellota bacterium]